MTAGVPRAPALAIVGVVLLSGCAGEPAGLASDPLPDPGASHSSGAGTPSDAGGSNETGKATGPRALHNHDARHTLVLRDFRPVPFSSTALKGRNCVQIPTTATSLNGTATVTWTPESSIAENLELVLAADDQRFRLTGRSPLMLKIQGVANAESSLGRALLAVQPPNPGVLVAQSVSLHVSFTYVAEAPVAFPANSHCVVP